MKRKKPENDTELETGEIIPFKIIDRGRLGLNTKPPDRLDWLSKLPLRCLFLAGSKTTASFIEEEYEILDIEGDSVLLQLQRPVTNSNNKPEFWVNSARFSQQHYLSKILGIFNTDV